MSQVFKSKTVHACFLTFQVILDGPDRSSDERRNAHDQTAFQLYQPY